MKKFTIVSTIIASVLTLGGVWLFNNDMIEARYISTKSLPCIINTNLNGVNPRKALCQIKDGKLVGVIFEPRPFSN